MSLLVAGTAVAIDGWAALLRGPSGAGKSDLALRLIETGAALIADDQVELRAEDGRLIAAAPRAIAGMIEARGIGVVRMETLAEAPVAAILDLLPAGAPIERMPPTERSEVLLGVAVSAFDVHPFEASCAMKVRLAVCVATGRFGVVG